MFPGRTHEDPGTIFAIFSFISDVIVCYFLKATFVDLKVDES